MKVCPCCNTQIDDNSLFCPKCGKLVPQDDACSQKPKKPIGRIIGYIAAVFGGLSLLAGIGTFMIVYSGNPKNDLANSSTTDDLEIAVDEAEMAACDSLNYARLDLWYDLVLNGRVTENALNDYLSPEVKQRLWSEDYDGCYESWRFRTAAQDYNPEMGDVSKIKDIVSESDGWYEITYWDMGYSGKTRVKMEDGIIVDFVQDRSWDGWDS